MARHPELIWLWELRTMKDPTGHSARILTASSRDRWGWYHDDCSVTWSTKAKLTKPPLGVDVGFLFLVTGTEQLLLTQSWELSLDVIWLSLHLLQVTSSPLLFARLLTIFLSGWCWCWDPDSLSSRTWLFRSKLFFTWKQNKIIRKFQDNLQEQISRSSCLMLMPKYFSPGIYSGSQNYWLELLQANQKEYEWRLRSESERKMLFWLVVVWCILSAWGTSGSSTQHPDHQGPCQVSQSQR